MTQIPFWAGNLNGDGEPSVGLGAASAVPLPPTVVWAKQVAPGNHDPVYAQFVDGTWTAPIVVCSNPADDLDPQWWQGANGRIHVAWRRTDAQGAGSEAFYASRAPGEFAFSVEQLVSRPDESAGPVSMVVLPTGEVIVGYEADSVEGTKRLVVASKVDAFSGFQPEYTGTISYAGRADFRLESAGAHAWATWVDSPTLLAYAELFNGAWTPVAYEPYSGSYDIGPARIRIQRRIVSH